MQKDFDNNCMDEKDLLYHLLEEQIAHICVLEEEEQVRKEIKDKSNTSQKDISKN